MYTKMGLVSESKIALDLFFFFYVTIFKVFIECVAILLMFYVGFFFWPRGMWDLSVLTRGSNPHPLL